MCKKRGNSLFFASQSGHSDETTSPEKSEENTDMENFDPSQQTGQPERMPAIHSIGDGILDSTGNTIVSYASNKSYDNLVIASEALKTNETYTICVDGEKTSTVSITGTLTNG